MSEPEPPSGGPDGHVRPVIETSPAGTLLWRVHPAYHGADPTTGTADDGRVFNPGFGGPTRFAPLTSAGGISVPTLYAGKTRRAALFETVLRDQMPMSDVDSRHWLRHRLTALGTTVDIDVVSLHGPGLRSLGLYAADLTHTYPTQYDRTRRWATWLHTHTAAAGLAWNSKQDDDERAFVLWEDRLPPDALTIDVDPMSLPASLPLPLTAIMTGAPTGCSVPIGHGEGLDYVQQVAAGVRIEVT